MRKKSLVLFDYDGVIVDSLMHNVKIAKKCSEQYGFDNFPSLDDIRNMDNMTFEDTGMLIGFSKEENRAFLRCVFDRMNATVEALSLFPGIRPLLKTLSLNHILAVLTANREKGVLRLLAHKGLSEYVSVVVGSDGPGSKSDKAALLMKRYKMPKERTYLIGDTVSDVVEARKAGVKSIAVTWGFQSRDRLLTETPDFMVGHPQEIEAVLMTGRNADT